MPAHPGGNESYAWRSVAVAEPKPGRKREAVILNDANDGHQLDHKSDYMRIINTLRFDPLHLLVYGRKERNSSTVGTFLEDVRDGTRMTTPNYDVGFEGTEFVVDNNGAFRARRSIAHDKMILRGPTDPGQRLRQGRGIPGGCPRVGFLVFRRRQ